MQEEPTAQPESFHRAKAVSVWHKPTVACFAGRSKPFMGWQTLERMIVRVTRRFFFHFDDGTTYCRDDYGLELPDSHQAYLEAAAAAREMWPGLLAARCDPARCAFDIADEAGALLFRLEFRELSDACHQAEPSKRPAGIAVTLEETHRRAQAAREDLRSGLAEARQSLDEVNALIGRFAAFQQPPAP